MNIPVRPALLVFSLVPILLVEYSQMTHEQAILIYSVMIIGIILSIHRMVGEILQEAKANGGEI